MEQLSTATPIHVHVSSRPEKRSYRFETIDLLRGLIMIVMALDHTRDFFHKTAWTDDPLNFATTTPALFLTRWITHYCAPIFVFLAGSSAWFQAMRKTKKELSWFLISRGLWLVVMEVVVVNFLFGFDIHFGLVALQTIWSIGISMVILGFAIRLPFAAILTLGALIVLQHNVLDFYEAQHKGSFSFLYNLLHHQGIHQLDQNHYLLVMYPFLPWTGLMMLGYCFGKLFTSYEGQQRKKILFWSGIAVIAYFIGMRALNIYGNPEPWQVQKNSFFTVLSFIDTHKYPPSLLYMCMTIGPAMIFLSLVNNTKTKLAKVITVYGRVPFFYYLAHFLLLHLIAVAVFLLRGHTWSQGFHLAAELLPNFVIPGEGFSLAGVYLVWIAVVVSLYPFCRWYNNYKNNHKEKRWLSYL